MSADATEWVFKPAPPFDPAWRLRAGARLEDPADNSVRRVFDRDLTEAGDDGLEAAAVIPGPPSD